MSDAQVYCDPTAGPEGVVIDDVYQMYFLIPASVDISAEWDFCITNIFAMMSPIV